MKLHRTLLGQAMVAGLLAITGQSSLAAVTAVEAKQLGTTLTEFGAEKSGNADGSIPAYTGGIEKVAGYDPYTADRYIDPFKDDKPLYSVTAANMAQYEASLPAGAKVLLKNFPGYRVDVYPSHRSIRYTPIVLQNSLKNATTASLAGAVEGDTIAGADKQGLPYEGIPFPMPRNGYEVMWNHNLRFAAAVNQFSGNVTLVDSAGTPIELTLAQTYWLHPWYDIRGEMRSQTFDAVYGHTSVISSPVKLAGIGYLGYYPVDSSLGQKAWLYTPGQRRIRPAPDAAYDMLLAGSLYWDELGQFSGRMDRFDFRLSGKREMLVPYNVFGLTNTILPGGFIGKKFINPDAMRWEMHRVWVVDAIRKPTASHAFARRTYYVDEDCWCIVASEGYDNADNMARVNLIHTFPSYATGGVNTVSWTTYDLLKGNYYFVNGGQAEPGRRIRDYPTPEGLGLMLTPQSFLGRSAQ